MEQGSQQKPPVSVSLDAFVYSVCNCVGEFAVSEMMIFFLSLSYVCAGALFVSVCECECVCVRTTQSMIFSPPLSRVRVYLPFSVYHVKHLHLIEFQISAGMVIGHSNETGLPLLC